MRFLSCHIENFGRLSDFSFEFAEGINIICEGNGWGKSTLAAFIRAMFYGLEGDRKRSLRENERKKYKPWQGGVFGGWLTFETKGRQYRISRIFYDKELNDVFELRDVKTNLPSEDYSKKIGEEIFGIDRESFLRTVFIDQDGCETCATDDINERIGNLADGAKDLDNFDAASARLTEVIHALTPSRASGALAKRREEIARCERVCKEGEGIPESMEVYRGRMLAQEEAYDSLKKKLKEAGGIQERASRAQSALAKKAEWERLKGALKEREEACGKSAAHFPGKIPALSLVKEQLVRCAELGKAYERVSAYRLTEKEEEELGLLGAVFDGGVPDPLELDAKRGEASEFSRIRQEYETAQLSVRERERLSELARFLWEEGEAARMAADWARRGQKKAALPSNQAALAALQAAFAVSGAGRNRYPALFFAGILLMAVGILTAAMASPAAGAAVAVLGLAVTAFWIWKKAGGRGADAAGKPAAGRGGTAGISGNPGQHLNGMHALADAPEIEDLTRVIGEDSAYIERTDSAVAAFLRSHGREFDGLGEQGVAIALQETAMEAAEYRALVKKAQAAEMGGAGERLDRLREGIEAFLYRYKDLLPKEGFSWERYAEDLYTIKERAAAYTALSQRKENYLAQEEHYGLVRAQIAAFYEEYGFAPKENISMQLNDIRDAAGEHEEAVRAYERALHELDRFGEENDVSALAAECGEEDLPSLEEIHETIVALNEQLEQLRAARTANQKALSDLQEQCEAWEENRIRLSQLRKLQEEEQKKYELVVKTKAKLSAAKETMTAKYAAPIRKAFSGYYELLTKEPATRFYVDANTAVTVEECGKQRETETLSRGWRDLTGLCLRLALTDAMYRNELPVLVMDDPFANFDDEKVAAGGDFLREVAKRYQVVYFTCSRARGNGFTATVTQAGRSACSRAGGNG